MPKTSVEKRLLEQYKVWRRGGDQSQPPLEGPPSGGISGGGDIYGLGGRGGSPMQIDIGLGGAGKGTTTSKPRVSVQKAKELGIIKPDPKVWRRGDDTPPPAKELTPKEKLAAQAQDVAQKSGETVLTLEPGSFTSRMLDRMFPEPKASKSKKIEPKLTEPQDKSQPSVFDPNYPSKSKKIEPKLTEPQDKSQPSVFKDTESELEKNARNARYWRNALGATGLTATGAGLYGLYKAYDFAKDKAKEYLPQTPVTKPEDYKPTKDDIWSYDTKNESKIANSSLEFLSEKYHVFKLNENAQVTTQDLLKMAQDSAERHGVPLSVVLHAMHKETGWMQNAGKQVYARSPAGALGVMQIMPDTAKYLGLEGKDIFDPQKNIDAGVRFLAQNLERFKDPKAALAAYNAGPNSRRVKQFIDSGNVKFLPKETRKYVADYTDDIKQQLAKFVPNKKQMVKVGTDALAAATGSKSARAAASDKTPPAAAQTAQVVVPIELPVEHPVGTLVNPDWSKYEFGDLGQLEKVGPGRWRSSKKNMIITNAPELDKLPSIPPPETISSKLKRVLPPALGGGGELVSRVFGDKKASSKTTTSAAPDDKTTRSATPDVKTGDDFDARMADLEREQKDRAARLKRDAEDLERRRSNKKSTAQKPVSAPSAPKSEPAPSGASGGQTKSVDAAPTINARKEFEKEFAKQRSLQGAGGQFSWTNPNTGKTSTFTTDYETEKANKKDSAKTISDTSKPTTNQNLTSNYTGKDIKSQDLESNTGSENRAINTELNDILRLAGRI
jgi:hypothetical protein